MSDNYRNIEDCRIVQALKQQEDEGAELLYYKYHLLMRDEIDKILKQYDVSIKSHNVFIDTFEKLLRNLVRKIKADDESFLHNGYFANYIATACRNNTLKYIQKYVDT